MASLSEISARAGVSLATASRVLSGSKHPVAAATRERVMAAAEELGYSPSALARALVNGRSRIIGIIVGDIVDPYFAEIAHGVEGIAARSGYLTMLCSTQRSSASELAHLGVLRDYQAAGVVFTYSEWIEDENNEELRRAVDELQEAGCTVASLAHRPFECLSVRVDNHAIAFDVTDYLVSLGHRTIQFVEGPAGLYTSEERHSGYRTAMEAAGLKPPTPIEGGFDFEAGYNAALRIMASPELPDAILGANDEVAIGVLSGLRQAGIDVPKQVSLAGIDDTRPSRVLELTTVGIPLYEMGAVAARAVLTDGEPPEQEYVLPHRLKPRATTTRRVRQR